MKVGLDISQTAHFGGVATYTNNLATGLENISDIEVVFFYSSLRRRYQGALKHVKQFKMPPTVFEFLFNSLRTLPIESFIGDVDIFHSSDWTQPPSKALKVTTYHDLVPLKYPQWSHPKIVTVAKRRLKIVEKEIDMVIAVSESTKKDLIEVSNIPEEKIKVIYEGVSEVFKPASSEEIKKFKEKYKLPDQFVLGIAGVGTRRNLEAVRQSTSGFNLIIAGENIPLLSVEELRLLYSSAKVLLYPSFYEGFGLPILEAMACGTPVITSNVSSMPEVGGDAALYVNPKDISEIRKALQKVWGDSKLADDMKNKGIKRARQFTWKKCITETFNLYKDLLNNSSDR